jgi:tetratricopeptide (TPR) repeat protein
VPLALARLNAMDKKVDEAKIDINKAIELKNNYTDAYYTLAQLEIASNNISGAIKSVEAAAVMDPNNSGLYFQLGVLKYNQKDYNGAVSALGRAISLVPDYANAKYFLGLSYYELGRKAETVKIFEELLASNPDNQSISAALVNLKAGKAPLATAETKVSNKDKAQLPVKEKSN